MVPESARRTAAGSGAERGRSEHTAMELGDEQSRRADVWLEKMSSWSQFPGKKIWKESVRDGGEGRRVSWRRHTEVLATHLTGNGVRRLHVLVHSSGGRSDLEMKTKIPRNPKELFLS